MLRHAELWLPQALQQSVSPRRLAKPTHVMFCVADHFEPNVGGADPARQRARVERWIEAYPALASRHRDGAGSHPRHTFFYPAEAYEPSLVERLATLCRQGFGEVEVQLHHDGDTEESLRAKLERAKADFARHGLLARQRDSGQVRFGFVHGNWALDNARRDGRWCGVNNELTVLREAGCYADFTLPSAPSETQTRKINSVYYAADDPRPKSHDTGRDATVGLQPNGKLLMVQGPLTLNWSRRKYGILPRMENGELTAANPPSARRVALWVRQAICVRGREDWIFVKVHTHGAREENADTLLGQPMDALFTHLETACNDGDQFRLHYVTARQLVNIIKAAEQGRRGDPSRYRDLELLGPSGGS